MNKLLLGLLILLLSSCSSDSLKKLSINCLCNVSAHYSASTDKGKSNIKEFSFTNSKLFDLGISEEDFALSSAIQINNYFEIDSGHRIKVNLVKDSGRGKKKTTSYTYEQNEIEKLSSKYFKIETILNDFVENTYKENFSKCKSLTDIPLETTEFDLLMTKILNDFEKGYIDTRIISYKVKDKEYYIYGGIYTNNKMLNLFKMNFKETENGIKIIAFNF